MRRHSLNRVSNVALSPVPSRPAPPASPSRPVPSRPVPSSVRLCSGRRPSWARWIVAEWRGCAVAARIGAPVSGLRLLGGRGPVARGAAPARGARLAPAPLPPRLHDHHQLRRMNSPRLQTVRRLRAQSCCWRHSLIDNTRHR